jgi:hypothetical protein
MNMSGLNKTIFLFFSILVMGACSVKQPFTVRHVSELETGHSKQGYFYSLPRNIVTVDVTILKTEEIPGPFAQFAEKYLGIDAVINRPATHYSINDVSINSFAEPDPAQFYFIESDANLHVNSPFSMQLNEGGIITAFNTNYTASEYLSQTPQKNLDGIFGTEATFNHFMETNLQEKIDTILESVRMDTITIERKTLRRTWVEKTSEVRAKEVAEYIIKIRDKRFEIMSGFAEITYSKEAIQYMNDQLMKLENDYLELFTGITGKSIIKYRYTVIPDKDKAADPVTLFFFDDKRGIIEQPHAASKVLKLNFSRDFTTRQMGVFTIDPLSGKKPLPTGFYYRIPEHANIAITLDDLTIAEARLLISQFGIITSLPPDDLMIEFYPNTGTVKSIEKRER